jgi:hypothetical protein
MPGFYHRQKRAASTIRRGEKAGLSRNKMLLFRKEQLRGGNEKIRKIH